MWKYFDGQHAFILKRMRETRASAVANVEGSSVFLQPSTHWCSLFEAVYDRTTPRVLGPSDLTDRLASELRVCVPALESKQGEATIGDHGLVFIVFPSFILYAATTGNQELWEAIVTCVKSVSEAMVMSLPSFWRIAKNFSDGKYKRVGRS